MSYTLLSPPLRAPVATHAQAITKFAFSVSPRTMERWGLEMQKVQGKRQPLTSEVWAAVLARLPIADHPHILQSMPQAMADQVLSHLPSAKDFYDGSVR
jgi:hypothetical protein